MRNFERRLEKLEIRKNTYNKLGYDPKLPVIEIEKGEPIPDYPGLVIVCEYIAPYDINPETGKENNNWNGTPEEAARLREKDSVKQRAKMNSFGSERIADTVLRNLPVRLDKAVPW